LTGRVIGVGPIGRRVGINVGSLRRDRGLSRDALAARLRTSAAAIPASGIARIEAGTRRVDVDELVALALALRVETLALLERTVVERSERRTP